MRRLAVLVLAVALAGCAPAVGGGLGLLLVLVGGIALLRTARAGAPLQCGGTETPYCDGGVVRRHCCPSGAKCNYRSAPYTDCGQGLCAPGGDRGRCPAPTTFVSPARSEQACKETSGSWELACLDHKVTRACIPPVPTNFSGPARNAPYRTCGGDRCTTHALIEECLVEKRPGARCSGDWRKVCFGGKVRERCVPRDLGQPLEGATYVTCADGSCAVGTERSACP